MSDISLTVIDREGDEHQLEWEGDESLMETLRANDFPVLATCGGTASCGTCHVFVAEEVAAALPEQSGDELVMLSMLDEYRPMESRLSCQIKPDASLNGITVTIAPEE